LSEAKKEETPYQEGAEIHPDVPVAITKPIEPPKTEIPQLPKCVKCGREAKSWEGEETKEGFTCNRCIKIKCHTCGKEYSKASGVYEGFQCKACQEKEHLERLRLNAVADFTFENAILLEKILKAVEEIQDEPLIEIKNDGILIRVMDPSRVAMLDYFISKRAFHEYRVHTEGFLLVDLEGVLKQIRHLRKDTLIKALVDGKDGKFTITLVDARERQRTFLMLEVEKLEVPPAPKLNLTARVKVIASDFYSDLEDMGSAGDTVSFEADHKNFIIKTAGELATAKNQYSTEEGVILEVEGNGDNRAVYSLSYLKALIRKDLSDTIVFEWSKDMPLRITHENVLEKGSRIVAYMAPRIEVED